MKYIEKSHEPDFLVSYRNRQSVIDSLNNATTNRELRQIFRDFNGEYGKDIWDILWKEQGGICAYCGSKIDNKDKNHTFFALSDNNSRNEKGKVRREHLIALSTDKEKILSYFNLVAVCQGNEKTGEVEFHCDKKKDKNLISIFPTNPNWEDFFSYKETEEEFDGIQIEGITGDAIDTISEKKLNLNIKLLQRRRFDNNQAPQIISSFKRRSKGDRKIVIVELEKTVENIYKKIELDECCFVTKFFLQRAIENLKNEQHTEGSH